MNAWPASFHPFGWQHGLALAWTGTLIIGACVLGRRWRASPNTLAREAALRRAWGVGVVLINVYSIVYFMMPQHADIRVSLPLQLCDLACLAAAPALLTRWRLPKVLTHFWGLALCTQAFITPTLTEGEGSGRYWAFWLLHLAIVGTAIYGVVVERFRPTWRDCLTTIGITATWTAAVFVLNIRLGSNYGYVGPSVPDRPTIVDALGPWPWRVLVLAGIVIAAFIVVWALGAIASRRKGQATSAG